MPSLYFLLFLLLAFSLTFAQIVVTTTNTLLDASRNASSNDPDLIKAYNSILETHPELQLFSIVNATSTTINTTGTDYYIVLKGADNTTVMAVVSLETNMSAYFVSFIKVDKPEQPPPSQSDSSPAEAGAAEATNNIQPPQAILGTNNSNAQSNQNKTLFLNVLGGYHLLTNTNDIKFKIAIQYLRRDHPNLMNYQIVAAAYQVVTGVNYLVQYIGLDNITQVTAKVYVGLSGEAFLMEFNVSCVESAIIDCNDELATHLYFGNEYVINFHPELTAYRIISIYIEEQTTTSTTFMTTFENSQMALRAITEVMVKQKVANVLSFYSYRYL